MSERRGDYWSGICFGFSLGVLYMATLDLIFERPQLVRDEVVQTQQAEKPEEPTHVD